MEPRSRSSSTRPASRSRCGRRPRSRTSRGSCSLRRPARPSRRSAYIAPDVGGGFGGKLQTTPEEWLTFLAAKRTGQAGEVHRDPVGVADGGPPRPRPVAAAHPGGDEGGPGHRSQGRPARRHGLLHRHRRRRRPGARRVDVQRDLQVRRLPVHDDPGADQQDLGRRLPRRRPAGGDVRHRAADERARRRAGQGPARGPRDELDQARGVPVHDGRRHDLRLRQLRGRDRAGQGDVRVRRAPRRAAAPPRQRRPGPARHRRLDVHRDVRPRAVAGARPAQLRRRRLGARRDPDAADRQGRGHHRRLSPHGQGHETAWSQIVADRLGVPFEDIEVLHGDTQVSVRGLDTYGSRSLVVGGEARGAGGRQGHRAGEADRGAPARGLRRTTSSSPPAGSGPRHRQGRDHPGGRDRGLGRARPARRGRAEPRRHGDATTRSTSPSRTAPTCARWRSTPRPVR